MRSDSGYLILIDGYNVIKRHHAWDALGLAAGRGRLLELLERTRWPIPVGRLLVVFDGPGHGTVTPRAARAIQVRFAAPSADAYIQETIRTSRSGARLAVISDDGEILRTAKSHRVRTYSTRWLLARSSPTTRQPHETSDKATLPASTARRITDELAKRWLGPPPP